jgi:hypothetical protein
VSLLKQERSERRSRSLIRPFSRRLNLHCPGATPTRDDGSTVNLPGIWNHTFSLPSKARRPLQVVSRALDSSGSSRMYRLFGVQDLLTAESLAMGSPDQFSGTPSTRFDTITAYLPFPPPVMSGERRQDDFVALDGMQISNVAASHSQRRFRSCNQAVAAEIRRDTRQPEFIRGRQERRGSKMATLSRFYASLPLRRFVLISRDEADAVSPATPRFESSCR